MPTTEIIKNDYPPHPFYNCIDAYIDPEGEWLNCPNCGLHPKIWLFDNGRSTACGCWNTTYDRFSIHAESIVSAYSRKADYNPDELRKNWNHWCKTGEILFEHASKRKDGRW